MTIDMRSGTTPVTHNIVIPVSGITYNEKAGEYTFVLNSTDSKEAARCLLELDSSYGLTWDEMIDVLRETEGFPQYFSREYCFGIPVSPDHLLVIRGDTKRKEYVW